MVAALMDDEVELKTADLDRISADLPVVVGQPESERGPDLGPRVDVPLARGQGATVGPYELVGCFRSSTFALVFLAYKTSHLGIARPVVLKIAPRSHPEFARRREMLIDEYRAMALLDHPNVAAVLDAGEIEAGAYVALEHVDGIDLRGLLASLAQRRQRLRPSLAVYIAVELLRGLEHAHVAKAADGRPLRLVHRDVTPTNVLVSRQGQVKLIDFGVAKMRGQLAEETLPGTVKGKPAYLAPEYIRGLPIDHRLDLYSAGIVLFELLTGQRAFAGTNAEVFSAVLAGLSAQRMLQAGVPADLVETLGKAVDRDPDHRYSTAAEMGAALEAWLEQHHSYVSATHLAAAVVAGR
jgi:serine/threonine protein kinase